VNWTLSDPACIAYRSTIEALGVLAPPLALAIGASIFFAGVFWIFFKYRFWPATFTAVTSATFGVSAGLLAGVNRGTIVGAAIPAFITLPLGAVTAFLGRQQLQDTVLRTLAILATLGASVSFGFFYGSAALASWNLLDFDASIYKKEVELTLRIKEAAELKIVESDTNASDAVRELIKRNASTDYRFGRNPCFEVIQPKIAAPLG
jgi:hypothetical protein